MNNSNKFQLHFGPDEEEEYHLFLYNKNTKAPIIIENIGVTNPNPNYRMAREENKYFIFEYIVSGKGYLEIDDKKYTVQEGDVYIIEPNKSHCYYSDSKNPFKKIWINILGDFFIYIFKRLHLSNIHYFPKSNCQSYFIQLLDLARASNQSDEIAYQACQILFSLLCYLADTSIKRTNVSDIAYRTKQILDNSLYKKLYIEDIEKELHCSKSQINREFDKHYHTTPYNYLLTQKLNMAKRLLITTNATLIEISDILAFSDPHYFSRIFKKYMKISPKQYRITKRKC